MITWDIIETKEFEREFRALPSFVQQRFERQLQKVRENPFALGKPLGYSWFRELKNEKWRVYYLIYDKQIVVLLVGVSDKKTQRKVIDVIQSNFRNFKDFIEKNIKK